MMPVVYLGLGSNIGDKQGNIASALCLISKICEVKKKSRMYLTEPVGNIEQDWFLNCIVEIETEIEPKQLLSSFKSIERKLGRAKNVKNGPRIIDIDILFYGNNIVNTKNLVIPHPLLHERLFVLQPMIDLNPDFIHPVLKKSIQELYKIYPGKEKVLVYK
jgi:2-amino-4-hydroxy-6-hydroxymethyldihydropteridine diphosphokinase